MNVGQAVLASLISVSEPGVVDTAEVKDRRLHVVYVNRVGGDVPCEIVGRAVNGAGLDSTSGEPPAIRLAEVVTSLGIGGIPLAEGSAAELSSPNNERVVEHAPFLEVAHQGGRWAFGVLALLFELGEKVAVLIPTGMHQLHKPYTALKQPPGDQAVVGEGAVLERVGAVSGEGRLRFVGEVNKVGDACLHPKRHFILSNPCVDFGVAVVGQVRLIQGGHVVKHRPSPFRAHSQRVGEIGNEISGVAESDPLIAARQESASPVVVEEELPTGLPLVARRHHDKRRQVVGHAAKSVGKPGSHARPAWGLRSGHEEGDAWGVVHRLRVHAADKADFVGQRADVREHFAELDARLPIALERFDRGQCRPLAVAARHRGEPRRSADAVGDILARVGPHDGLGIEEVDVRRPSALPEDDDALGLGGEMRQTRQPRFPLRLVGSTRGAVSQQRRQGRHADSARRSSEELPARDASRVFSLKVVHVIDFHRFQSEKGEHLFARQRFIEVEDCQADRRERGVIAEVESFVPLRLTHRQEGLRPRGVLRINRRLPFVRAT